MTTLATVPDRKKTVRELLARQRGQLEAALPKHVSADRLLRTFFSELSKTPGLYECTDVSLLGAIIQAAQLGLEFGGVLGQCYLVPFSNRKRGITEVQFIPGYKGLLKLARNSGSVASINARIVHAGDRFEYQYGLEPFLIHKPIGEQTIQRVNGKTELIWPATHYYATARLTTGAPPEFEVMTTAQVEAHRDKYSRGAKNPDSAWVTNFDEMALKTVLRRLCRLLPASAELERGLVLDAQARHQEPQQLQELAQESGLLPELDSGEQQPENGEQVAAELAEELSALRTQVQEAEAGLETPRFDLANLRIQHLQTDDLAAVREPVMLQDYLQALPKVPRPVAHPRDVAEVCTYFEELGVTIPELVRERGGRPPAKWTTADVAYFRSVMVQGPEAARAAFPPKQGRL